MKRTMLVIGTILVIVILLYGSKFNQRFKTYAIRAQIAHAKGMLQCVRDNTHCISLKDRTIEDLIKNCPKIKCFSEKQSKYYQTIYQKILLNDKSIIVIKGKLPRYEEFADDIWILTNNGEMYQCVDGSGWYPNSENPLCRDI